jgi:hypothetical protein
MADHTAKPPASADKLHRTYLDGLFEAKHQPLKQAGLWRFVDASERYNSAALEDTLIPQVFVFQVL